MLMTATHTAVGEPAALRAAAMIARAMPAVVEKPILSINYSNSTGYCTSQQNYKSISPNGNHEPSVFTPPANKAFAAGISETSRPALFSFLGTFQRV
jgi:hypothetical protein